MSLDDKPARRGEVPQEVIQAFRFSPESGKEAFAAWYERRQQEAEAGPSSKRLYLALDVAEIYIAIGDREYAEETLLDLGEAMNDTMLTEAERSEIDMRRHSLLGW